MAGYLSLGKVCEPVSRVLDQVVYNLFLDCPVPFIRRQLAPDPMLERWQRRRERLFHGHVEELGGKKHLPALHTRHHGRRIRRLGLGHGIEATLNAGVFVQDPVQV